jgi:hypothetical protein
MFLHLKPFTLTLHLFALLSLAMPGTGAAGSDFAAVFGPVDRPDFDVPNHALAVDSQGFIYLAGPASSGMTVAKGAYDSTYNGGPSDIFIAKFDGRSSVPLAVTFLGGGGAEWVRAIMVDQDGSLVLTGSSNSPDFTAASDGRSVDLKLLKEQTVFIARIDNTLKHLKAVNFLGPGKGLALAGSSDGSIYLVGQTQSAAYPPTSRGWDMTYNGGTTDVFVARLADGLNILRMTFFGGKGWELARAIVIEKTGDVILAGFTDSQDFPVSANPFGANPADTSGNGFIARFGADLDTMVASVLLGGSGHDVINSLVPGTDGSFYVTGLTASPDFPTTPGSYDESFNGEADIFASRISSNFEKMRASTFLGGTGRDWAYNAAFLDDLGIYIAGDTDSESFPGLPGSISETRKEGAGDIVVLRLDPDLTKVDEVNFTDGKFNERVPVVIPGRENRKVLAGLTNSPGFPAGVLEAKQPEKNGYNLFLKYLATDPTLGVQTE